MNNIAKVMAKNSTNKRKIQGYFKDLPNASGIYVLTRFENDFKYAYV